MDSPVKAVDLLNYMLEQEIGNPYIALRQLTTN